MAGSGGQAAREPLSALGDRLVVPAYKTGATLAHALPAPVAAVFGRGLGKVLARTMKDRRAMVSRHQQRLSGHTLGARELEQRVDAAFESYARYWVDAFRLTAQSTAEIDRQIDVPNAHYVDDCLARGHGAILAMPHIGAWDLGGAWMAHHWGITVVAEALKPPALFEWFCERRAANGMQVVALGPDAGGVLLRALNNNQTIGLLCDRDILGGGIEVDFFGERTTLPAGPATLSLRTGAPILPNAVYQVGTKAVGDIRPPIQFDRCGKLRADVQALTQLLANELESLIAAAPEQWHVLHPNWPSDEPSGSARP